MQQTLSVAEAQAIIATPKFAVRPIKWQKKQGNYIPARFHFESILQIKTTIREDLLLRLSYRGAYNISRAGIAIARDANITAGLYVANHRISAYDYDTTKPHINHIGAGLPYHRQHITGLHRHIWTNEGDGYAEPLLLTDCQPATIIHAFVTDNHITLQGSIPPLPHEQLELF